MHSRLSESTRKMWMKIDPHYQRRCSPMTLISGNVRLIIIIIIIIQHLYSAMESEDTEALGGARLRHVKQMSF